MTGVLRSDVPRKYGSCTDAQHLECQMQGCLVSVACAAWTGTRPLPVGCGCRSSCGGAACVASGGSVGEQGYCCCCILVKTECLSQALCCLGSKVSPDLLLQLAHSQAFASGTLRICRHLRVSNL